MPNYINIVHIAISTNIEELDKALRTMVPSAAAQFTTFAAAFGHGVVVGQHFADLARRCQIAAQCVNIGLSNKRSTGYVSGQDLIVFTLPEFFFHGTNDGYDLLNTTLRTEFGLGATRGTVAGGVGAPFHRTRVTRDEVRSVATLAADIFVYMLNQSVQSENQPLIADCIFCLGTIICYSTEYHDPANLEAGTRKIDNIAITLRKNADTPAWPLNHMLRRFSEKIYNSSIDALHDPDDISPDGRRFAPRAVTGSGMPMPLAVSRWVRGMGYEIHPSSGTVIRPDRQVDVRRPGDDEVLPVYTYLCNKLALHLNDNPYLLSANRGSIQTAQDLNTIFNRNADARFGFRLVGLATPYCGTEDSPNNTNVFSFPDVFGPLANTVGAQPAPQEPLVFNIEICLDHNSEVGEMLACICMAATGQRLQPNIYVLMSSGIQFVDSINLEHWWRPPGTPKFLTMGVLWNDGTLPRFFTDSSKRTNIWRAVWESNSLNFYGPRRYVPSIDAGQIPNIGGGLLNASPKNSLNVTVYQPQPI